MKRSLNVALFVVATLLVSMSPLQAEDTPRILTVADYLDLERVSDPQLSPDGRTILYTRSWIDRMEDRWRSDIWIMNADGSRNRFLSKGSSPRWSPDGARVAFLDEGEPTGTQLFVRWLDAAEATQITRVDHPPSTFRWAPDGKSIAFVMRTSPDEGWQIDLPDPPEGAKWTEEPLVIEGVYFRQDRRGFMEDGYLHLFTVEAGGGTPRQLTSGKWNVGARTTGLDYGIGIDWTPDGKEIVFVSRRAGAKELWTVPVSGGVEARRLPVGQDVDLATLSPIGDRLAYARTIQTNSIAAIAASAPSTVSSRSSTSASAASGRASCPRSSATSPKLTSLPSASTASMATILSRMRP